MGIFWAGSRSVRDDRPQGAVGEGSYAPGDVLIDDNTDDEALWRPVEAWCERHGVKFAHLDNWPGYKSGALNYALPRLTSPEADVIGVVDSDSHNLAIGLADHEYAHPECALEYAGHPVRLRDADLNPDPDRDWILDRPRNGVAEITSR